MPGDPGPLSNTFVSGLEPHPVGWGSLNCQVYRVCCIAAVMAVAGIKSFSSTTHAISQGLGKKHLSRLSIGNGPRTDVRRSVSGRSIAHPLRRINTDFPTTEFGLSEQSGRRLLIAGEGFIGALQDRALFE
jgi:hypothetical protein